MKKYAIIMLTKPKGGIIIMLRDILGIFLLPLEVVAIMLLALMVDSSVPWIHWTGVILVAGTMVSALFLLGTMISVCRR